MPHQIQNEKKRGSFLKITMIVLIIIITFTQNAGFDLKDAIEGFWFSSKA